MDGNLAMANSQQFHSETQFNEAYFQHEARNKAKELIATFTKLAPELDEVSIHKIAFACTEHILIELYPQPKEIYNFWYAVQEHINSMV